MENFMTKKTKIKIYSVLGCIVLFALLMVLLFAGENFDLLRSLILEKHTHEELKAKLMEFGIRGHITITLLSMLQVVLTFLPAEPTQVLAGVAFGFPIGIACCMVGVFLGNSLVYLIYRLFGDKVREYFIENLHFDFDKAAKSKRVFALVLILYFLPAIPYGMICFFAASVGMKYPRFMLVTLLGSLPSVCIGVGLGHVAMSSSWIASVLIFILLITLLMIVMKKRDAIFAKVNAYAQRPPYSSKTTVKKYGPIRLPIAYFISTLVFIFKGVRIKKINKLGKQVDAPSIVLCNHGAFADFAYAGRMIYRRRPNFIVARLYFYKKTLGNLMRSYGCFPKSMFAADLESAKNCLRVLKGGGVLAMMPEARLSTVGKFEDIQESTYSFLQKAGVPIYTIKITGDYFASPKWGDGLRRGSKVFAELDILLTKEEVAAMTPEEIKAKVEERLYYDEFEWIKTQPKIKYKRKTLAEGLENILTRCPVCKGKYTITTKGHTVSCEKCGKLATLDNRYSFLDGAPFKNFAEWYEWQREEIKREIAEDENYTLTSPVELLMHSEDGKKMLRSAGTGVCTLDRSGLNYKGTKDGEDFEISFPIGQIYKLLFGAGENFEIYSGSEIYYFRPSERRSAVDWYITSDIIKQ